MSISIAAGNVHVGLGTPSDRRTDQAMAAQDQATETQSQGMKLPQQAGLDRLLARPDGLARFR
ncbi:hypothetical protein [Sphingomonas corticis]|jgi:hypothetical protein|uniref:Uncharacterized protein n=1 Tax=Sphingomonas corticis TaxID=2722791 RepID=A0ABX1CM31_9SPHN|nr:hypothetical protein [Sphingomonas corticis]NJR78474.1 hypothetical protein [Sphingomonas corticis]